MKHLFLFFVFIHCILSSFAQSVKVNLPEQRHAFTVIAHRGNHIRVPENTIASIREAIKIDADYVGLAEMGKNTYKML